jgi:TPR repeat protein
MRLRLAFLAAALVATPAFANYEKGMQALGRGDVATGLRELRTAAEAGDQRAYAPLARAQLVAAKSVQDLRAAREWGAKAAAAGVADAQYVVYAATVSLPELNYFDAQGKLDAQRYKALAARPIADREDEMTAYDMLGKAAQQNHAEAAIALAGYYADNVGDGNRGRSIALLDKAAKRPPVFDDLRKRLGGIEALGPTLATVRFFDDAVAAGRPAAVAAAAEKDRTKKDCTTVKPLKVQRLGPIEKAVWLPLAAPEMRQSYLMQGNWREIWTFDVCGAETGVILTFTADGLGGATVAAPKP